MSHFSLDVYGNILEEEEEKDEEEDKEAAVEDTHRLELARRQHGQLTPWAELLQHLLHQALVLDLERAPQRGHSLWVKQRPHQATTNHAVLKESGGTAGTTACEVGQCNQLELK